MQSPDLKHFFEINLSLGDRAKLPLRARYFLKQFPLCYMNSSFFFS